MPTRRAVLRRGLMAGATLLLARAGREVSVGEAAGEATPRDYRRYAVEAYGAMQRALYRDHALYAETADPEDDRYAFVWPFSHALAATLDMTGLPEVGGGYQAEVWDRLRGAARYFDASPAFGPPGYSSAVLPPLGSGGDKYYDDNSWLGLAFLRDHRLTGNPTSLALARRVFDFVVDGWDRTSAVAPGGVYWKQQTPGERNHDRNAVSNAPTAELGLRLFQLTGQPTYYDSAIRMYDWVNATLRDTADNTSWWTAEERASGRVGLYWDHLDAAGAIERTKWSYNQGTMIGANVLLHQIHGARTMAYLLQAEHLAGAALGHYDRAGYRSQDPPFNATFFRNLLFLAGTSRNVGLRANIRAAMEAYADKLWDDAATHDRDGLFRFEDGPASLLDQAAMVEIYALLAMAPAQYDLLV
jgi:hypothetical protein